MSPQAPRPTASVSRLRLSARKRVLACALGTGFGVGCLASAAVAQPPVAAAAHHHHASHAAGASRETVDQRITSLHGALMITSDEEPTWAAVAQTMRWNAAAMEKMVADRKAEARSGSTALDDLKAYERFNRAHLEGLKALITSFGTLYNAMPDSQKTVADHVFRHIGRNSPATAS